MKILTVFTGGTIGSKATDSVIDVDNKAKYRLIDEYRRRYGDDTEFQTAEPINILSENLSPKHWQAIFDEIRSYSLSDFDGIIVTHGSDTLAYTCAVFSFLLSGISIPVIFVAANKPLDSAGSNGYDNFINAVQFIKTANFSGVFAIYQDENGENIVYQGAKLMPADSFDKFSSFGGIDFGKMKNSGFLLSDKSYLERRNLAKPVDLSSGVFFERNIAVISPYPGLCYKYFDFHTQKCAAILHLLYHSSTACISGGELARFAERCAENGIDMYLLDCRHFNDSDIYSTAAHLKNFGANLLSGVSPAAAYAKLCVAYNQRILPPDEFMMRNIACEFSL